MLVVLFTESINKIVLSFKKFTEHLRLSCSTVRKHCCKVVTKSTDQVGVFLSIK